jgi:muramoyltetrapeptide carboxypeptidase
MLKPPRLIPGDKIAVVAPASGFAREEFDRGIVELRELGFDPVFENSVFERHHYVAGSAEIRARAFLNAWNDPSVRALLAVRGGYGSVHILPYLDRDSLRRNPKAFIGYSDLTTVLAYLNTICGIVAFHGPMLDGRLARGVAGYDRNTFLRALTAAEPVGELETSGVEVFMKGDAKGVLVGGTVAQLAASLGTPFAFDPPEGCILFLEDVSERPYRLDRLLTQLRLSGILSRASGIVLGEFVGCDEPGGEPTARDTLKGLLSGFQGPVIYGVPSGHTSGPSVTLPFGVVARVVANEIPRLVIEEAAVA